MRLPPEVCKAIQQSDTLLADVGVLADCGGRFAGSESERLACKWLNQRLRGIPGVTVREQRFEYRGWRRKFAQLTLSSADRPRLCHPLILSPDTPASGLEAEVVHLGRGTAEDFERNKADLPGRIALVEHEYPFSDASIHRRIKYNRSRDEGCVGFIIANNLPDGGLITGSSGEGAARDIPAIGVEHKTGRELFSSGPSYPRVRMEISNERFSAHGVNLIAELLKKSSETVVLCAHYDGHDLAESALDNASGLAVAIQIFESLLPYSSSIRRSLRLALFTNEEWRLFGSRTYVSSLGREELERTALVVNLDTLAGSSRLGVITNGFEEIGSLVEDVSAEFSQEILIIPRLIPNSDHFNFAIEGVPAMRFIAGFNQPDARTRYLLTSRDSRDLINSDELRRAAAIGAGFVWRALTQERSPSHKDRDAMQSLL